MPGRRSRPLVGSVLLALVGSLLLGACAGGDRPSLGDEVAEPVRRTLDPSRTYLVVADGAVAVHASAEADEDADRIELAGGEGAPPLGGLVLAEPYETDPDRHEVHLPDGGTGWVDRDAVRVDAVNVVAVGRGTEVDPAGGGGGEVPVYARARAARPAQRIANPTSAEGLNVAPVSFLVAGPYDPSADRVKVYLPVRPNGSTGWVDADAVDVAANRFRIEVALSDHRLRLFEGEDQVLDEPIGVGTGNTPTPGGVFYIRSLIASTDPAYGTYAFGLSGFSEVHQQFNGGPGDIGIHGTNDPSSIGVDSSNGCIRLHDETVVRLAQILPEAMGDERPTPQVTTGLGVPVEVQA